MYDSFLYGNGLTIGTLYGLIDIGSGSEFDRYLDFDVFMKEFVEAANHSRIKRRFEKLFDLHLKEYKENRDKVIENIKREYEQISAYGFERWISKGLLVDDSVAGPGEKLYSYLLYNYWYHIIADEILYRKKAREYIESYSKDFLKLIDNKDYIYTTNFDMIHDDVLHPKHLHGKFTYPLKNVKDIMYKTLNSEKFEYKFLLGTNGFEKLSRINNVKQYSDKPFDDGFFYSDDLNFGNLLIYGLAFGKNETLTKEFLTSYPEHTQNNLVMSVDGHIIVRLQSLYEKSKLEKITIGYYSQSDLENYKLIFQDSQLNEIIQYKKSNEIVI